MITHMHYIITSALRASSPLALARPISADVALASAAAAIHICIYIYIYIYVCIYIYIYIYEMFIYILDYYLCTPRQQSSSFSAS